MINSILSKKYFNKIIVATNLQFDFNALFFGTKYWSKFKIIYSGSRLLCAVFEIDDSNKITFLDTGNFLPLSVEQMGDMLKIPKLNKPKCLGKKPRNEEELNELITYNKRDCEISRKFLLLIQATLNLQGGQLKITIASSAMDLYRRKYHRFILRHEQKILGDDNYYDFLFNAYYGGRTEAFSRGKISNIKIVDDQGHVTILKPKVYDINSLYPSAMLNSFPHPASVRKVNDPSIEHLDYYFKFKGVMKVKVRSPKYMKYPYLPHKYKTSNGTKLLFPLGTWSGTYTNFELKRAVSLGYTIEHIYESYLYKASYFPFKEYVEDLYSLRMKFQKEKSPFEIGVKLLLNSLYGKFGQRYVNDVSFIDLENMNEKELDSFTFQSGRNINMHDNKLGIETTEKVCDSSFVFPIFPIYVTAYSRDKLYDYIVENDALYCDTDSILTYSVLPEEKELGKMKVEYDVISGVVIKPKMYMYVVPNSKLVKQLNKGLLFSILDQEYYKVIARMKGVSRVDRNKFNLALDGKLVSYNKFTKTKESVRRGMVPNSIIKMDKKIDLEDNKRTWDKLFDPRILQHSQPLVIDEE